MDERYAEWSGMRYYVRNGWVYGGLYTGLLFLATLVR